MRPDENQRWLDLADRLGSGEAIDWDEERATSGEAADASLLRSMHTLSAILQLHTRDRDVWIGAAAMDPGSDRDPTTWAGLRIEGQLGRGSYGTVYDAYDPRLDRAVALKLMHPGKLSSGETRRRVLEEGRALARVRHANLVQVHGIDEADGRIGIWMERVEGETLAQRIQRDGPLGEAEVRVVAQTLGQALAAVHGAGLLHRDVKAQNVMREAGGRIVLMDFGAATPRVETGGGRVTGTPLYLAPELLQGAAASPQSDVYALGVLLFHLATGTFPVQAAGLDELKAAHFSGTRRPLTDLRPDFSPEFDALLDRATDADPRRRFTSAGEFVQGLATGAVSAVAASRSPARPRIWWPVAAVIALLILGALALPRMRGGGDSLQVESALHAWSSDGSRRELLSGAAVTPGDQLSLDLTLDDAAHVYVLTEDDRGTAWVMFPRPEFVLQNPVPAGAHVLPERDAFWGVDTAGGREHILILASRRPLTELERQLTALEDSPPRLADGTLARVRGIGSVVRRSAPPGSSSSLLARAEAALADGLRADGVWMRTFVLDNPPR